MRNLNDIHYSPAPAAAGAITAAGPRVSLFLRKTGSHAALAARSTA